MPKLSEIDIDSNRFRGKGIRPWNDPSVVKPSQGQSEITNKPLAKREQIVSKPLAKREHTTRSGATIVSNALAKREQINKEEIESVSNTLAQPLAVTLAEREQTVSKPLANSNKTKNTETIETLVGNERILLNFLFQKCKLIGSLESPTITTDELRNLLKIKAEHLRNLIYRLSNKGVIEISKIKNGRAGWRKFQFSKEIFQCLSLDQSVSNMLAKREQLVSNTLAKPLAEPLASSSSSSGSNNYINTTTTDSGVNAINVTLPDEWQNLDMNPLGEIGFTKTHLNQIASQNKLSAQTVQDSIYAFAFDLQENNKAKSIKGDAISFFMGILRNGQPYAPPSNYESPQDKAMRVYLERKREIERNREEAEKEIFSIEFKNWFKNISDEQKLTLLPEAFRRSKTSLENNKILESSARSHFEKEIWPHRKAAIQQTITKPENL